MPEEEEKQVKKNSSSNILIIIVVAVIFAGAGFFGGMKYQQTRLRQNFSFIRNSQTPNGQLGQRNGATQGFRPVNGKIIKSDENGVTLELSDGSSKIILINDQSSINKTESASKDDLAEGTEITVFGQENSDGSITAQNIQIGGAFLNRVSQ